MDFHIQVKNSKGKWERIASFQNFQDRDLCLDLFADTYSDCNFRQEDKDE